MKKHNNEKKIKLKNIMKSIFETDCKKINLIIFFCIVIYIISRIGSSELSSMLVAVIGIIGFFYDEFIPPAVYLFCFTAGIGINTWAEALLMVLTIGHYLSRNLKIIKIEFIELFVPFLIFVAGFLLGENASIQYLIVQLFSFYCFVRIKNAKESSGVPLLLSVLIMAGICVSISTIRDLLINGNIYGRLGLNENVRDLANAIIIPSYYFLSRFINYHDERNDSGIRLKRIFLLGLGLLFVGIMVFTYSRGSIVALIIGVMVFILLQKERSIKQLIPIILLTGVVIYFFNHMTIDLNMMTSSKSSQIRIEIYKFYLNKMISSGLLRFLFGFGSGDIRRTVIGEYYGMYYAHSTILDYFFQYGLCGFSIVIYILTQVVKKCVEYKEPVMIGFSAMCIVCFIPYGSSDNILFHVLMGMCCSMYFYKDILSDSERGKLNEYYLFDDKRF